jgi:hypothetical protein
VATYGGTRRRRPRLLALAFVVLAAAIVGGAIVGVTLRARGEAMLPVIGLGGMALFYALMIGSMLPRKAAITIEGGAVQVSWRQRPLRVARIEVGRWVMPAIDTATGMLLELVGDDGARLRIGGSDHDGRGYPRGAGVRAVDVAVTAGDFDAIARELGVARRDPRELRMALVRSSQSAGGVLGMMAPWLLTIAALSVLGVGLGMSGLGERLQASPHGMVIIGAGTMAVIAIGIGATVTRSLRVRAPGLELVADDGGLVLIEPGRPGAADMDREVARAPWPAVRAAMRAYVVRMKGSTWTMPALELAIGDHALVCAAWAHTAWPGEVARLRRAPRWLAGAPQWSAMVAALQARGRLTA